MDADRRRGCVAEERSLELFELGRSRATLAGVVPRRADREERGEGYDGAQDGFAFHGFMINEPVLLKRGVSGNQS